MTIEHCLLAELISDRVALGFFAGECLVMDDGIAVGLDRRAHEVGEDVRW
ncbi:hypothetical protein [Streptosporangium sp. NPDC002721]